MSADAVFEFAPLEAVPAAVRVETLPPGPEPVLPAAPAEMIPPPTPNTALVEQARADGYAAGAADAHAALEPAATAMAAAAQELAALRSGVAERTERAAVSLALRIAEQAIQGAIAVEPERVVDVVRGALRRLVERDRVLVLVHPDDLDLVREHADLLVAELGGIEHCGVEADRRVGRGGAMVRTGEAEVDATLETKLVRAREVIEEELSA